MFYTIELQCHRGFNFYRFMTYKSSISQSLHLKLENNFLFPINQIDKMRINIILCQTKITGNFSEF